MKREQQEQATTQAIVAPPKQEILPPAPKAIAVEPPNELAVTGLDISEFQRQIRLAVDMLDLGKPEGWLDSLFGRPDHRIEVKTERGQRLAAYIAECTEIINAAGVLQDARRQQYLKHLVFLRQVAEEQVKFEFVRRQAERQEAVEAAKANAEVARFEGDAREQGLRGRPVRPAPAAPPPPPAPKPEDVRAERRRHLWSELDRLTREEKAATAKVADGKPQAEWTDEMQEEITRIANMYFHAKEKVCEELRKIL